MPQSSDRAESGKPKRKTSSGQSFQFDSKRRTLTKSQHLMISMASRETAGSFVRDRVRYRNRNSVLESSRAVLSVLQAPQPIVEVRDAKTPAIADVTSRDLAASGLLLKRLRMNAKKSGGFVAIEQRLELD